MKVLYILTGFLAATISQETPALKELEAGNLAFSAKSYRELARETTGNLLVSPLSVAVILALVEAGAGGETAKQLIAGLNLPNNEDTMHEAFKALSRKVNVDDKYTLTSANKIYLKEGSKIKAHYKDVATQIFNAEIEDINFTKNTAAAEHINKWVLDKTHNKIKDLVSSSDLNEDTRAILINALYFHGLWLKPFYVETTAEKVFHVSRTTEVKVNMMHQTDRFNYYEDPTLKAKFLEMRYRHSPVSMTFVLPDESDGLAALETNIEHVLRKPKFASQKVNVQIPHVNIENKIDFIPILRKFGVKDAFENNADLSGIIESPEALKISKVIQKTFIAVEEKGTTAAAATFVGVDGMSLDVSPPKEFEANHPFIFIVRIPDGILFVGRYVEPRKQQ